MSDGASSVTITGSTAIPGIATTILGGLSLACPIAAPDHGGVN